MFIIGTKMSENSIGEEISTLRKQSLMTIPQSEEGNIESV